MAYSGLINVGKLPRYAWLSILSVFDVWCVIKVLLTGGANLMAVSACVPRMRADNTESNSGEGE